MAGDTLASFSAAVVDPTAQRKLRLTDNPQEGFRRVAEELATEDPFVLNGVVRAWEGREWNEALA